MRQIRPRVRGEEVFQVQTGLREDGEGVPELRQGVRKGGMRQG